MGTKLRVKLTKRKELPANNTEKQSAGGITYFLIECIGYKLVEQEFRII